MSDEFFDQCAEHSQIKAKIVSEYFDVWAQIILLSSKGPRNKDIAYIDLFSGPGRYEDGTESTPLLVLRKAIANSEIGNHLISIFTDKWEGHIESLEEEIGNLPGIENLKEKPQIEKQEVGAKIVKILNEMRLIPSLVFLDPCGYKGLSLALINSVIKDWACECIFFFNYNRINAGIHNEMVEDHINAIFGEQRAEKLRLVLRNKKPYEREKLVLDELMEALKEVHGRFVHPFRFSHKDKDRTSHYLIFVTKHFRGYEKMKEIMGKYSSSKTQGVPSYECNPFYEPDLFYKPLDELKKMLLSEFAGQTLAMCDIYTQHSVGKRYTKKNYKEALVDLAERENMIKVICPGNKKRRKGTMGDNVMVVFPSKE